MSAAPTESTVWVCDECGYWRQDKTSGIHMAANQDDWRGRMVSHSLREAIYVPKPVAREAGDG